LSKHAVSEINEDIARRFSGKRIALVSCGAALLATIASAFAIRHGLQSLYRDRWLDIIYWSVGYFVLYLTAARATDIARFYGTFADHLALDADRLFALDPSRSVLVMRVAAVGRAMLLFWVMISCSVVTLFGFLYFGTLRWFVLLVVPAASFFSLGVGTGIFLSSESKIRRVANGVAESTLQLMESEISELFSRRNTLTPSESDRMKELKSLHQQLSVSGWYRGLSLSGLSLLIPLAGPIVSIVTYFLSAHHVLPK
jgi:hypothetical protein